jgi:hypothetical protein
VPVALLVEVGVVVQREEEELLLLQRAKQCRVPG